MIQHLCDLAATLRNKSVEGGIIHDALKKEPVSIDLIIKKDGSFIKFIVFDKVMTLAEALPAKKGKARLLLDRAEEVLGYGGEKSKRKHEIFLEKLELYTKVDVLKSIQRFYHENKDEGIKKALKEFEKMVPEKERTGNIAFRINNEDVRIHEKREILNQITDKYEAEQKEILMSSPKLCSICGKTDYPVADIPHGMIKRVPDGQTSGCALISYNDDAYESYNLKGNNNSSICTHCAKEYVEAMNWLLSSGNPYKDEKGKGHFRYSNRKNFGSDTAMVFWTKKLKKIPEIDLLEVPSNSEVQELIESIQKGKDKSSKSLNPDMFFSFTLSGAAARIAIRDWIESSLEDLRRNIAHWFDDIKIQHNKKVNYSPLWTLASACKNKKESNDFIVGRIATILWNCAIKDTVPPIWIISTVLNRIRRESGSFSPERAALLRFTLNRNNKNGGARIMEQLDEKNANMAYVSGRIFAVLESIQWYALGETNAGIRERFFSSASTTPAIAFGRLLKMSQHHLSKLKGEKPGLAVNLDKKMQELMTRISSFPVMFKLEDQGNFAIGYYHQKEELFNTDKNK